MSLDKEGIQYLMESGITPEDRLISFDNEERWMVIDSDGRAIEIEPKVYHAKDPIMLSTLTGFVNYVKGNLERIDCPLLVHVYDEKTVFLKGLLDVDGSREILVQANAIVPRFAFDSFMDSESFVINFQAKFVQNEDRNLLLKVMGNVVEENVRETGDDGVSQAISIRQGVASKSAVKVPNPVELAPYRTFLEIEQPTSQFVFRLKDGPRGAIFEADGGAWRNMAIINIREYLQAELAEQIAKKQITILA